MRLCQELVLGIGGVRALRALGIDPAVWHLNEGHSAFLLVERARELVAAEPGLAAAEALRRVGRDAVFTIHTPVPAGNEVFGRDLVRTALASWFDAVHAAPADLIELGRGHTDDPNAPFDMTAFVLRHAADANAVSQLHGATATETWQALAGHPIRAITNGVHVPTWLGRPVRRLVQRAVGVPLGTDLDAPDPLRGLIDLDDEELWSAHLQQKREMIGFIEGRIARQLARHGESPDALRAVRSSLDPNALTIGFARRFATYKRAALLFSD
jgi:starch phosphorylase